jgi:Na+/proline symporter
VRVAPLFAIDAALIVGFAALGRRSHEEGSSLTGILGVAAPFLVALSVGWLVARAWRAPLSLRVGVFVWLVTVVGGLALRSAVFGRGIAPAFIAVAFVTLGVLLVGWRAAARVAPGRRALPGG